jgi:hypothetical protein
MSTLDESLSRLFAGIDVPAGFHQRLMARVHRLADEAEVERARVAREREETRYRFAGQIVMQWRSAALRLLSLDAIAASTLVILVFTSLPKWFPHLAG